MAEETATYNVQGKDQIILGTETVSPGLVTPGIRLAIELLKAEGRVNQERIRFLEDAKLTEEVNDQLYESSLTLVATKYAVRLLREQAERMGLEL